MFLQKIHTQSKPVAAALPVTGGLKGKPLNNDYTMKKISFRSLLELLKNAFQKWWGRDPFRESAIIAYYAIFSLPGLLVVVMTIAGYFWGAEAVTGKLHAQVSDAMGNDTADQVQNIVKNASQSKDTWWATLIGIGSIIFGATGVFAQFQKSLNSIWEVEATAKKSGFMSYLKTRIFSFGLVVSIAFLLLISLVISSLISAFSAWVIVHWSESLLILFRILNGIFSLSIIAVLFALMFKFLPDAQIRWSTVWIGAFFTALLFVIGKTALGLYFGTASPGSGYGAAGSIVLILLWTSYTSMIVFLGAEFTKVYSDHLYGEAPPSEHAVKDEGCDR
jgi:membrane protein